jgi:uncharacterized membrane protein YdjX (TVP38/TMEM64 family)
MRLAAGFVILAALFLGSWLLFGGRWEEQFTLQGSINWLESAGSWAWLAGLLLLIGDLVLPVPGTIVISALGFIYGVAVGGLIAGIGLSAAGMIGYGIGRLLGHRFARRWLGEQEFEVGHRMFTKGGGWMVAMSRALPVLPEVISCTAGLVGMPFKRFAVALACGSFPMGFLFAAIGHAGREAPGWALVFNLILPALLWWAASHIKKLNIGS